ncbi:MAG TPA: hypothetical protein VN893_24905 [Bryobacteraceae bacterium]|nr:hypothetical protein [Bryobacteraceae bacterium]
MIPLVASVSVRNKKSRGFRLWIPLALVWLLLLPVALLLLPVVFVACLVGRSDPFQALSALWQILSALKGSDIAFDDERASVLIHVF